MNSALTAVSIRFHIGGKQICRTAGGFYLLADRLIQVARGLADKTREELEEVVADVQNSLDAL